MLTFFFLSEAPTILTEVAESDPIMQQDVFGPVLPVLTVNDMDEAIAFINKQGKPLCVYAYSSNSKVRDRFKLRHSLYEPGAADVYSDHGLAFLTMQVISRLMSETSSGSFCSNDGVLQTLMVALPFGGVGKSVAAAECKLCQT